MTLIEAKQNIIDKAISIGFTKERAEWIAAEFDDVQRIHGYAKAYEQVISRLMA